MTIAVEWDVKPETKQSSFFHIEIIAKLGKETKNYLMKPGFNTTPSMSKLDYDPGHGTKKQAMK